MLRRTGWRRHLAIFGVVMAAVRLHELWCKKSGRIPLSNLTGDGKWLGQPLGSHGQDHCRNSDLFWLIYQQLPAWQYNLADKQSWYTEDFLKPRNFGLMFRGILVISP